MVFVPVRTYNIFTHSTMAPNVLQRFIDIHLIPTRQIVKVFEILPAWIRPISPLWDMSTDHLHITEILLKVALTPYPLIYLNVPLFVIPSRSFNFLIHDLSPPFPWFVTSTTRGCNCLTFPGTCMSSPPVFSWVRVARSLVFSVVFCRSLFLLFLLVNVLSLLLGFTDRVWFPFWYLQTFLMGKWSWHYDNYVIWKIFGNEYKLCQTLNGLYI